MIKNSRAIAASIITEAITEQLPLQQVLVQYKISNGEEHSFIQALCYGCMRFYLQLEFIADKLLAKPLPDKHFVVHNLLLIGLLQLLHMRVPDHAAIFETVEASKVLNKLWAGKVINGVLRSFQRQQQELMQQVSRDQVASSAHPLWLLQAIKAAWPAEQEAIIAANNCHPPLALRVNTQQSSLESAISTLSQHDITTEAITNTPAGLIAETSLDVTMLDEFKAGMYSIQDGAAMLAATLLDLQPGQAVLDACAAPGGKTCHMLELEPQIKLTALDKVAARLQLVRQNIKRLQLPEPCMKVADAALVDSWWDNILFDRILLDAPCSATGIIRRQPDVKVFRTAADIAKSSAQQRQLLNALWPLLQPGGILLYATCSILPAENEELLAQFVALHPDAAVVPINLEVGCKLSIGLQILPGQNNMDGFYYAKLQKKVG